MYLNRKANPRLPPNKALQPTTWIGAIFASRSGKNLISIYWSSSFQVAAERPAVRPHHQRLSHCSGLLCLSSLDAVLNDTFA
jgi:hypothetical protein